MHANSLRPGGVEPHVLPVHLELPLAPEKPIDLQMTAAEAALVPLLQTGSQVLSRNTSGRPAESDSDTSLSKKKGEHQVSLRHQLTGIHLKRVAAPNLVARRP